MESNIDIQDPPPSARAPGDRRRDGPLGQRMGKQNWGDVQMELKKPAAAGTLESSDVQIILRPNPGRGIAIRLDSDVMALFGDAIEGTVRAVLAEFAVEDALVEVHDRGALDFAIRARMECAVCRAAEISFDWGREDPNG